MQRTPSTARRRASTFRRFGWLAVALMVSLSIVGPGTAPVAAAAPNGEGGSSGISVQADAPLQPTLDKLIAGTANPAPPTDVCKQADFGFVVDRSGSIGSAGAEGAEESGITGFVDAFAAAGGDAVYAGARFNNQAAATFTNGFVSPSSFKSAVNALNGTSGRTPTGEGINAGSGNTANNRSAPNVLFVVTDGSPNVPWSNANINTNYPSDPNGWLAGANDAIAEANAARAAGWIVLSIYVGAPDSGLPFSSADDQTWVQTVMKRIGGGSYTSVANFNGLVDALLIASGCSVPPGSLEITKHVTGDTDGFAGGTFSFSAACGPAGTFTTSITLAAGVTTGKATIADIPANASCTVTETSKPPAGTDFQWKAAVVDPSPVTIESGKKAGVTVTNPRDFVENPSLGVKKTAKTANFDAAGDLLSYEIVATNLGNVTLTNVQISDPKLGALTCSPVLGSSLAPNATMTCSGTYTTVQGDVDAGKVDNKATADSAETTPVDDTATVPGIKNPLLGVEKTAKTANFDAAGDLLSYEIVATNLGNVTLTNVQISDPKLGALTCSPVLGSSLAPNATMTCSGTYTTVQGDVDAGKVDNKATADSAETTPVDDTATVPGIKNPLLGVEKTAKTANFDAAGDLLSYEIVATNLGNVTLTNVQISDPKLGALTCSPVLGSSLAPNATMTCSGTYTTVQGDVDAGKVDNKATADSAETTPVDDTATVPGIKNPLLGVEKTAKTASFDAAGDLLSYEIVATNLGNVTLHNVMVTDTKLASLTCDPGQDVTLAPGESVTCSGTYTTVQGDVDAGKVDNTATAYSAETPSVDDSATVPAVKGPALGIVKTADTENYDAPGDVLHYTLVATNLGNVTLTNVQISDPKLGALTCSPVLGSSLAPNATMTCSGTYTTVQGDVDAGKVDNTATADSNETTPVDDSASVPAVYEPGISITKLVSTDGEEFFHQVTANVGQELQYRIVVENTGNVTLTQLTLADNLYNDLLASFCDDRPATLPVGQSFTCEYHTDAVIGTWQNTATTDSAETNPVDDTAIVVVHAPTSIIVQKLLDLDGKLSTKKDQVPAAGWTFTLSGDPGMTGKTAGSQGLYTFDLTGLDGSDVFDLSETVKKDFKVLTASCEVTDAVLQPSSTRVAQVGDSRGTFVKASAEMQEVEVNAGETITCTFINTSGQVERATATPRVTPPPTDAAPTSGTPGGDSWRIVLLAIAALLAMTLLLTPATPTAVRRRR